MYKTDIGAATGISLCTNLQSQGVCAYADTRGEARGRELGRVSKECQVVPAHSAPRAAPVTALSTGPGPPLLLRT